VKHSANHGGGFARGLQLRRDRGQLGLPFADKTVTAEVDDTCFRVLDQHDTMLTVVPGTNTEAVTRSKVDGPKATIRTGAGTCGQWISHTAWRHSENQPC
jgi:hypothetical protein